MTMSVQICVVFGLPASHKTTFTNLLLKHYITCNYTATHLCIVNYDLLMPSCINFCSQEKDDETSEVSTDKLWKKYRDTILQSVKKIINVLKNDNTFTTERNEKPIDVGSTKQDEMYKKMYQNNLLCECYLQNKCYSKTLINHIYLIDDNMFYRSMRYQYLQLARQIQCSYSQIFLKTTVSKSVNQNKVRASTIVTDETILKMADLFEEPDSVKYPWEENTYILEHSSETTDFCVKVQPQVYRSHCSGEKYSTWNFDLLERVSKFLTNCFEKTVQSVLSEEEIHKRAGDILINLESFLQYYDQLLRKQISTLMVSWKPSSSKHHIQLKAKQLNDYRKMYLKRLRENEIAFPHQTCKCEECQKKIISLFLEESAKYVDYAYAEI